MTDVDGLNAGFARDLLEEYLENPDAVPSEWRRLFESGDSDVVAAHPGLARLLEAAENGHPAPTPAPAPAAAPSKTTAQAEPASDELLGAVAAAMALVKAHRMHGHLAAHLDPLGSEPPGDPALEPERLIPKLTPELQARVPAAVLRMYVTGDTLADALPRLSDTYTGTIAYEIEHIADHEKRVWLRQAIESGKYRTELTAEERKELLASLSRVEAFEQYLRRAFLGQKQFSIEGLDVMVPMLDEAIELAAENGAHEVVIGMAHRGRLNVLAHTLGLGYDSILREFEGERTIEAVVATDEGGTGDVKYHLGAEGTRSTPAGEITVTLAANPSHLEAVDPVVEGRARAEQTDRSTRHGMHDPSVAMPVLIHGDASFPGPGRRRRDAQPLCARGLLDRRHAPPDREQPGRVHDRSERRALDALLERPRQGLRRADHPRQRRRSGSCDVSGPPRARIPAPLRERRRRRPRRIPTPRSQRAGRGGIHAAVDGRADRRSTRPFASSSRSG